MTQPTIAGEDFEDWLRLDGNDENWVERHITLGLPLILPWKAQHVKLGSCFQSRLQTTNPWLDQNPFILSDLFLIPKILIHDYGSVASYQSVSTTRRSETSDHLSLGFGVEAGLPFIGSASVKGTFDEQVKDNKDSEKTSIRASVRCAVVQLDRKPRLSHEAIVLLKYDGGYEAFTSKYGDYFVWGYRLGGDTGFLVSRSRESSKKIQTYDIKASLKVLMVETSKTWAKDFLSFTDGKQTSLLGYDTLSRMNWNRTTNEFESTRMIEEAEEIISNSQSILERCLDRLEARGLFEDGSISEVDCELLSSEGLVVELILLPMTSLRDVVRWAHEHDVI